ncbi:MAG: sugar phosphate nucleotidyltransferase [Planctomycetota bacterium]|nr:sugar phosphate nucleotidyltransferase [Planctomycetota bacterium]MDA0933246.1 sugar phosphate nucleotidyltransferase [Planctomycetota bacterium]MDA1221973.1 sugar phosphate nucleotidyltransferase [Planctomycetota bacterium]
MPALHAVILAGGSGTRFWPASRTRRPKQLLPLARGRSLIGATFDRLLGLVEPSRIWVITNPTQADGIREALPELLEDRLLVEPEARDTAPCVAFATARVEAEDPGATVVFLPADHLIEPVERFQALLARGAGIAAEHGALVTFGIRPRHPATGYGYVQPGRPVDDAEPRACFVDRFREKPDLDTARAYVATGRMLWNSGIFVWTHDGLATAMEAGAPALAERAATMLDAFRAGDVAAAEDAFRACPRISVDYAVLEQAPRVAVVEADLDWNDVGSFAALPSVAPADPAGNSTFLVHDARAVLLDAKNCVVYGDAPRTVALFGVEDLVVVQTEDAILVCPRERAEELKALQAELRNRGCEDLL